ncbi:MAG TPA: endonuclease/exonuclease/phosphatase family protein [Planctomycetota bacterium]|nr:endonuclease/exonuclease/phosphatase family protein [Planctomycetota bacterium]
MKIVATAVLLAFLPVQDKKDLTVVTYNVLGDPVELKKRVPALMKLLQDANADVIALQEVVPWFSTALAKEEWARVYQMPKIKPEDAGGQWILSRVAIEKAAVHKLPGPQGRTVLVVTLKLGGRRLDVATTHLESPLQDGPVRAKQIDAILPRLRDAEDALFLGDFNFGDAEAEEKKLDAAYVDLWKSLKPGDSGMTWNIEASDMAKKGSFPGEKSRRLDRILLRSSVWKPKEIRIIGDQPINPGKKDLFPSDHFGLLGVLARD